MRTNHQKLTSLALGLCALLGAAACDDETTDSPDSGAEGGRVSRTGSGGKGGAGGKGGEGAADAGAEDAGSKDAGEAGKGGAGGSKGGDDECFDGEPKETKQFLNRCSDSECQAFDNAERLPLFEDGELPPLP